MTNSIRCVAVLACLVSAGCSTPNVNPPVPRANTGYIDFYTDSDLGLSWRVREATGPAGEWHPVFLEYKPITGNILRLAAPPGTHRFEIWFNNQVTTGPQTVLVEVANGKVTPVHVTLTPEGSASVLGQSYEYRPTVKATRRVTRISTEDQGMFQIGAAAAAPQEYRPKEWMPYFAAERKSPGQ